MINDIYTFDGRNAADNMSLFFTIMGSPEPSYFPRCIRPPVKVSHTEVVAILRFLLDAGLLVHSWRPVAVKVERNARGGEPSAAALFLIEPPIQADPSPNISCINSIVEIISTCHFREK